MDPIYEGGYSPIDDHIESKLRSVQIEAQVILRIIEHSAGMMPTQHAQGQLLGLDVDTCLHATDTFPYRSRNKDEEGGDTNPEETQYQIDMLRSLSQVNADSNTIGWYTSTSSGGNSLPDNFLDIQLQTQRAIKKSVVVVYDPLEAQVGKPAFKAYRLDLSPHMLLKKHLDATTLGLTANSLKELPITIRCSPLAEVFFMKHVAPLVQCQSDTLNLDFHEVLDGTMRNMHEGLSKFHAENTQQQQWERQNRQMQKNRGSQNLQQQNRPMVQQPADATLTAQQITKQCKQLEELGSDSFRKLFLVSREEGKVFPK